MFRARRGCVSLRIGIDATPLRTRENGIGRYTDQLVRGLAQRAPELQLVLFGRRSLDETPGTRGATWDTIDFPCKRWIDPFHLIGAARRIDLFHGTNYMAPLLDRLPCVITIHDMTVFLQPETHPWARRVRHRIWLPALCRRSGVRIIADSETTKRDVMRLLGVAGDRITVTRLAVDARFQPIPSAECERVRRRHALPDEFLLYLGAVEPRKNLPALLEALGGLRRGRAVPPLVVAGRGQPVYRERLERRARALGLEPGRDLLFIGVVEEADLPALYSLCTLFAYPSLYEGFGLPPLEAMACGAPVVVSDRSSLGELYADSALAVPDALLGDAIGRLLGDAGLRAELSARGRALAATRNWDAVVDETVAVYRAALAAA